MMRGSSGRLHASSLPVSWSIGLAVLWAVVTLVRTVPCLANEQAAEPRDFARLCYSDITSLYSARGIAAGVEPFSSDRAGWTPMEYPA